MIELAMAAGRVASTGADVERPRRAHRAAHAMRLLAAALPGPRYCRAARVSLLFTAVSRASTNACLRWSRP
jgi:hypothetical protein